jgi:hypothetical protein
MEIKVVVEGKIMIVEFDLKQTAENEWSNHNG